MSVADIVKFIFDTLNGVEAIVTPATALVLKLCVSLSSSADVPMVSPAVEVTNTGERANALTNVLAGMISLVSEVGADMPADVEIQFFMFNIPALVEPKLCFRAAFSCLAMAVLDCARVSHARKPSCHVYSLVELPTVPQLFNQEPPRAQQLLLPDFLVVPHFRQKGLMRVLLVPSVLSFPTLVKQKSKNHIPSQSLFHANEDDEPTFAGLHALRPPVMNVFVACTSAILIPSTARSATTDSPEFGESTALRTREQS